MSSVVHITPAINPLVELQKEFLLSTIGGEIRVMSLSEIDTVKKGKAGNVEMYKISDAKILLKRHLETLPVSCEVKKVTEEFFASPNTKVYSEIAFSPLKTPQTTLNYWVDSPVIPCHGDWSVIEDFLRDVICDGDQSVFEYLKNYLGHMLQKPEEKPGIFIVLLGGQGTGKGTFFRLIKAIWPTTTLIVSDVTHVIGQFNGAIERNYAVCMDEALFAGDNKAKDRLKSMVTEPTVTIEQKYQPRRTITSYHRFFAASNHDYFSSVDADDRRFLFLRVSDECKQNHEYWTDLHKTLDDSAVIAAMVYDLLKLDISGFNVRNRPKTTEHIEQKLRSLSGFSRYWYEVLRSKGFSPADGFDPVQEWDDSQFVSTANLLSGMKGYFKGTRQYEATQEHVIKKDLKRLCPKAQPGRKMVNNHQSRGYILPALPEARADFEKIMGCKIDWSE